ncbi:cytochrome c biogenesis heme-transporting ATPase CcmA [Shewanella sp. 1_MG-2023]|uniref:Cytochrome c biogenesis heme-transporting ATPase CcmA n=1 Tax=Shewanella electrodiphila TaxID=934143 RepID=A0ABT0KWA5_9GAMM|nr:MULTISPECIES: cytochrome c biogenesis heme-transporting ATPase CcmA [unclassified Shewanella]MCL1047934.1 cytochrome c biogenesis heme-transporting ATPase CcmA [Shewanella electrodiphila]MCC4834654.1 cytochrome c biogenesis heme-transporting ATPase CcmA [Shewanella sp. 10N.7]MDO6613922.1 cytochrome c biogenesis heme-transporting ATPase CcmA [Shewanella sp. 7_MG-2023]MDO6773695.1 cytochrome c biogenesis heme-transporting ATPase CcmA [Shewanella sp. 2_MG-2023]MDO6796751.1 cytochrome c biogene
MTDNNQQQVLVRANELTCIREDRILFDQLSFEINAGDIVQIEGPNGAGKTSLLRIIAGLSRPYAGEIQYIDTDINQCRDEFNEDLLYLGHLAGVKSELTANENLNFNLRLSGYNDFDSYDLLAKVNLGGFEEALAGHLSAGQHRRTALARLWHTNCRIWILDEPFTAIDKKGVEELEQLFIKHTQSGGCVIMTTHQDMSLITDEVLRKIKLDYRFV